jgi:3',5'-cyclic AMP phosphodiesterase CpdA
MKKIVHISDLHFGTEDKVIAEGLLNTIKALSPDLVVISGDLTQRARIKQFKAAKGYLAKMKFPILVVPGNHDIPLYNVFRRFLSPLGRYKKFITDNMYPLYTDKKMAVMGINSARSLTWKNGRISLEQIQEMKNKLCEIDNSIFKIIVTHHPFIPPPGDPGEALIGRSTIALVIISECGVDLLLAGHLHNGYSGDIRPYYPKHKKSIISAQAGTAISRRIREEPNGFNFISIEKTFLKIEIYEWNGISFIKKINTSYQKTDNEWIQEA